MKRGPKPRPIAERFWAKVDKSIDCWLWQGSINQAGYGQFYDGQRCERAHRIAYRLAIGEILPGSSVCHHCDTPACCNPSHLWLGTRGDNNRDMRDKDRHARGERNGHAKLTEATVLDARRRVAEGTPQKDVAAELGMSCGGLNQAIHGTTWKHVP